MIARTGQMEARFEGTPRLVVEVVSSPTRAVDWVLKRDAYAKAGAPYYWIVDTEAASIEALALQEPMRRARHCLECRQLALLRAELGLNPPPPAEGHAARGRRLSSPPVAA